MDVCKNCVDDENNYIQYQQVTQTRGPFQNFNQSGHDFSHEWNRDLTFYWNTIQVKYKLRKDWPYWGFLGLKRAPYWANYIKLFAIAPRTMQKSGEVCHSKENLS